MAEALIPSLFSFLPKVKPSMPFSRIKAVAPLPPFAAVGHCDNGIDLGLAAVRDPLLGPVQDIVVPDLLCLGPDALRIAARIGFRKAEGGESLPACYLVKIFLLLLLGAAEKDRVGTEKARRIAHGNAETGLAQFLDDNDSSRKTRLPSRRMPREY